MGESTTGVSTSRLGHATPPLKTLGPTRPLSQTSDLEILAPPFPMLLLLPRQLQHLQRQLQARQANVASEGQPAPKPQIARVDGVGRARAIAKTTAMVSGALVTQPLLCEGVVCETHVRERISSLPEHDSYSFFMFICYF